jgi:hypothetical protein
MLEPTPAASLAPIAAYTMVEPDTGGSLGAAGLPCLPGPELSQLATTNGNATVAAIRRIGERLFTIQKKTAGLRMRRESLPRMTRIGGLF